MTLVTPNGLRLSSAREIDESDEPDRCLEVVLGWMRQFLTNPHPELGRNGPVCPFMPHALDIETVWFAVPDIHSFEIEHLSQVVQPYKEAFLTIEPMIGQAAPYKTIILAFPSISEELAPILIDVVQAQLKPNFVDDGMMIGQFHANNNEPGLHNENFRPLRSPVPLLAIRWMVATDLPFLIGRGFLPEVRLGFLRGYMRSAQRTLSGPRNDRVREWALIMEEVINDLSGFLDEYPAGSEPE